jgi:hypothetical protein
MLEPDTKSATEVTAFQGGICDFSLPSSSLVAKLTQQTDHGFGPITPDQRSITQPGVNRGEDLESLLLFVNIRDVHKAHDVGISDGLG